MTRAAALAELYRLAAGLGTDLAGVAELLARVSRHPEAETLLDALVEVGLERVLDAAEHFRS